MPPAHRPATARLALRAAPPTLGALWAGALVVLGLWILGTTSHAPDDPWPWAAAFLLASGQFVFMVVVADRLIPPRRPALAHAVETLAALAAIGAALAFAFAIAGAPR